MVSFESMLLGVGRWGRSEKLSYMDKCMKSGNILRILYGGQERCTYDSLGSQHLHSFACVDLQGDVEGLLQ